MSARITRKGLQAWLSNKHPRTYVGIGRQMGVCPAAKYLTKLATKQFGHRPYIASVTSFEYFISDGHGHAFTRKSPLWLTNFVNQVDHYADETRRKQGIFFPDITAQRALACLRSS